MILFKRNSACIIHLLALVGKNKNIIDVVKSVFFTNFDQTMVMINFNSSISIILVARQKSSARHRLGDFSLSRCCLLEFGSLESPPSNSLRATRKPDVLVLSEICG